MSIWSKILQDLRGQDEPPKEHNPMIRELLRKMPPREARFALANMQAELIAMEPALDAVMDPEDLAKEFVDLIGRLHEERFACVFVSQSRKRLGDIKVFEGGSTTRTTLYPRVLFKEALARDATGIILCHNHPGGTALPSPQDRELTRRIQDIGESMEVRVIDHLIVTPDGNHVSFRRHGWMP